MFNKLITLLLLVFTSCVYGQMSNYLIQKNEDLYNKQYVPGDQGIGEVNDFNFHRRRFANIGLYSDFGSAFVNSGSSAIHISANMDILVESKEKHMFTIRFGGGTLLNDGAIEPFIPGYLNFLFGYKNMLETSIGTNFYFSSNENEGTMLVPGGAIGYRHQHPRGGVVYGILLNLTFPRREISENLVDYTFEPWVSFRFGWCW